MKECPLCLNPGILSFEHIPPQSLGNNIPLLIANENTFNPDSAYYKRRMRFNKGFGFQALCETCNKFLGANYVPSFTNFIKEFKSIKFGTEKEFRISTCPLNVIKLIYSNAVVINAHNFTMESDFRNYILDTDLNNKFLDHKVFIRNNNSNFYKTHGSRVEMNYPDKPINFLSSIQFPGISIDIIKSSTVITKKGIEITNFNKCTFDKVTELKIINSN